MQELSILKGPHRLVIGGGIGAGKSTVTDLLAERGAVIIEADAIGHFVIEPGGSAFRVVAERWPGVVVDGEIDRTALAAVVFADPVELEVLEGFTHPAIAAEIAARAEAAGEAPVAVEVPVLATVVGAAWTRVWVDAPEETRVARAVDRGMDEPEVRRRISSQGSNAEWIAWADHILVNDGTEAELVSRVDAWVASLGDLGAGVRPA